MILVVAPDPELRRSIEFLLEMEGLEVVSLAELPAALEYAGVSRTCTIIDEDAISGCLNGWERVADIQPPIVLLVDRLGPIPERYKAMIVRKPLLGQLLIDAVRAVIG
jgi:CheY-like chemotaxis protein